MAHHSIPMQDKTVRLWDLRTNVCQALVYVPGSPCAAFDQQVWRSRVPPPWSGPAACHHIPSSYCIAES